MSDTMQSLDQLSQLKPATPEAPKYVKKVDKQGRAYATGKRKDAVARVWIKPGAGKIVVNTREVEVYFARPVLRMMIQQPLDHHPQHRTGEIDFDFTGVNDDLAGAGLDPDAGNRVLALAGGIGTALLVDLLDVFRRFRRRRLQLRQLVERLHGIGHLMRPSCSCDSSKRRRSSRVAGPRADARARGKRVDCRTARAPMARAGSCARPPSPPRAREN